MTLSRAMYDMLKKISQSHLCFNRDTDHPLLDYVVCEALLAEKLVHVYETGAGDVMLCYTVSPAGGEALSMAPDEALPAIPDYTPPQVHLALFQSQRKLLEEIAHAGGSREFSLTLPQTWQPFDVCRSLVRSGYLDERHPDGEHIVFTLTGSGRLVAQQS